jgi:hypothetical protein
LFLESNAEQDKREKLIKGQQSSDLHKVKKAAVTTVANMIIMHTFMDSNLQVREDLEEGINYFKDLINKITIQNG